MTETVPSHVRHLPEEFLRRMRALLGTEAAAFFAHYAAPAEAGLRFNPLKAEPEAIAAGLPFELAPIPWSPHGRRIVNADPSPGLHPYHAAGLYYIQEPAAQAVAEILDPQPGERVLDLAAAPGGKATHIAGKMGHRGVVVANEIHPKRVWDLMKNLERWGARNVLTANETPERLADALPGFFDAVLLDAPCSGEGMFRKMPEAVRDWSPEFIQGCAMRQAAILETAAALVRPGGRLCYATCTFAPEEDEDIITAFLEDHLDFRLVTPAWVEGFDRGLPPFERPGGVTPVRLWPHRAPGEGHFIALLVREGEAAAAPPHRPAASAALQRLLPFWEQFAEEVFEPGYDHLVPNLHLVKSYLYSLPDEAPGLAGLNWIRPGLWLGSFKKNRFEPAHALAMALPPAAVRRRFDLDAAGTAAFLRRETLPSPGEDGWALVTLEGRYPLGWGKRVHGRLKNHYPAGLRTY